MENDHGYWEAKILNLILSNKQKRYIFYNLLEGKERHKDETGELRHGHPAQSGPGRSPAPTPLVQTPPGETVMTVSIIGLHRFLDGTKSKRHGI